MMGLKMPVLRRNPLEDESGGGNSITLSCIIAFGQSLHANGMHAYKFR